MADIFCGDDALAYERSRTHFAAGEGMLLDDAYRLAHLPLVAPNDPRVIAAKEGTDYDRGRHPTAYSVVLPVSADALEASPAYQALEIELRTAPFAHKVAWHVMDRRRGRLHATVCGGLGSEPPVIDLARRSALAGLGPIKAEVRGLFSGNVNRGRVYLRVYPEQRDGANLFYAVQRALGRPTTDLYVVGLWNLMDDLDADEAAILAAMIERWWSRTLLRVEADELWLLGARDDLVLDGEISARLALR
ncbi:hypothetical protein A5906_06485 [Bradyrhizobium sacchari]|uniref:Uncharacterized protein n=1 Tax=Bradyrhizobium sacchari TaxID=1399419 RepID=A0A560KKH1_9BRAD|nr:hypothetical protein [Bradyrhizobium sacchari]OPY95633.1 hypothetical protein A5906_06485 [Bradyrhizobium sacchari]TWB66460.1 hypothetical protein FBZ94_101132 [Bradyrhizobium sacchari]TWB83697.1 hypothetical protein FBZ95_101132 [Bradyrhizobium sacchari]